MERSAAVNLYKAYVKDREVHPNQRILSVTYTAARVMVSDGELVFDAPGKAASCF
jgi:hypothetical protein